MNEKEEWKDTEIEGYRVSSLGKVYSKKSCHTMAEHFNPQGDLCVAVCLNNSRSTPVHRLVAIAFVPNPNNYRFVKHKDNNPTNCRASNLYWTNEVAETAFANKKRAVLQYAKTGELIARYESINRAVIKTGITSIRNCLYGKNKTAGGYIWKFADEVGS